jgi:hypothetical protein
LALFKVMLVEMEHQVQVQALAALAVVAELAQ